MTSAAPQRTGWVEVVPGYFELSGPIDQREAQHFMERRLDQTAQEAIRRVPRNRVSGRSPRGFLNFLSR